MGSMPTVGLAGSKVGFHNLDDAADQAREAESLGYSSLWIPGGRANLMPMLAAAVRSTESIQVAPGVISVDRVKPDDVVATFDELHQDYPDRILVGLGGAHGQRPLGTLNGYLDHLDSGGVPAQSRILAALGPKMLALARDRAAGAYPFLVTPSYVESARATLGPHRQLIVLLMVIPMTDRSAARRAAAAALSFFTTSPDYCNSLRRQGFTESEIDSIAPRLVDSVTASGDVDAIASRVADYHAAGADQVVLRITGVDDDEALWRQRLAPAVVT